jgi:SAM-dependent methyltransferase
MTDPLPVESSHDLVGRYRQDDINGFSRELIFRMLDAADIPRAAEVLDAMAGDGNLTLRMAEYCRERQTRFPKTTVLEFSRVQAAFAKQQLAPLGVGVIWGDILGMKDLATGQPLPEASYDRILIKSANHEIPRERQPQLYRSVLRALQPGGLFVNLGMLFDDLRERDELREITRVKDRLAGLHSAVVNRYFLTREEFYAFLREAGFVEIRSAHRLEYSIRSTIAAEQYFRPEVREKNDLELQAAQIKAPILRRNGRLRFDAVSSLMTCPGEITLARRPTLAQANAAIFHLYPMDFLRHVRAHAEMLEEAAKQVFPKASVLDPGCGIGLLTEHLPDGAAYLGLDISPDFIAICNDRYAKRPGFSFAVADMNAADIGKEAYDVVTLLNLVNLPGVNAVETVRKAYGALRRGGRVVVSGPTSRESFRRAEPFILSQLEREGHLSGNEDRVGALRQANARILTEQGNYWSAEGMAALLRHLGFATIVKVHKELYYGCAYLVVAEK